MNGIGRWILSLRIYSFTASAVPIILALALAIEGTHRIVWWTVPLFTVAALLLHAGTNVLNDYYDHALGIDTPDDSDPTHVIPRGIVSPRFMITSGHVYVLLALLLGGTLSLWRGPLYFLVGIASALGAYFYTGRRFSLKYHALGDITVFLLTGPVLVFMSYWTFTGAASARPAVASLPVAFFVTSILHGNNMRDHATDHSAGISTVAGLLGFRGSRMYFVFLLAAGYGGVIGLVTTGTLPPTVLISLASLPVAWSLARDVLRSPVGPTPANLPSNLSADLPVRCARVHLLFGVLYSAGVLISRVFTG